MYLAACSTCCDLCDTVSECLLIVCVCATWGLQAIEESGTHWSKRTMQYNVVRPDLWQQDEAEEHQEDDNDEQPDMLEQQQQQQQQLLAPMPAPRAPQRATTQQPSAQQHAVPAPHTAARSPAAQRTLWPSSFPETKDSGSGTERYGCQVSSKHGVVCLTGPAVDAVAQALAGQVPERARSNRWVRR